MEQPPQPQHPHPHHHHPLPHPPSSMATSILSSLPYDHPHPHHHQHQHNLRPVSSPPQTLSAVPPYNNSRLLPPLQHDSDIHLNTLPPAAEDALTASASIVTNASSVAPSPNSNPNAFLPPLSMSMPLSLPITAPPPDPIHNRSLNPAGNCNNNLTLSEANTNTNTASNGSANGNPGVLSAGPVAIYDIAKLLHSNCTIFKGKVYNKKGHTICGVLNQHDKPCHRIGKCPFHTYSIEVSKHNVCNGHVDDSGSCVNLASPSNSTPLSPPKKEQYKHGWSKTEHYFFLAGLKKHKRGAWKQIAYDVKTRNPTQVQSHAQKYFLRQKQNNKNKKSIHDLTLDSPEIKEIEKNIKNGNLNESVNPAAAAAAIQNMATLNPIKNQPVLAPHLHNNIHINGNGNSNSGFDDFAIFNIPNGNVGPNDNTRSLANNTFHMPFGNGNVNGNGNGSTRGSHQYNTSSSLGVPRAQSLNENITPPQTYYATASPISNTINRSPLNSNSNSNNNNNNSNNHHWNSTTATNYMHAAADTKRSDALLDEATAHPIRPMASDPIPLPLMFNHQQHNQHDSNIHVNGSMNNMNNMNNMTSMNSMHHQNHPDHQIPIPIPIHGVGVVGATTTTPYGTYANNNNNNGNSNGNIQHHNHTGNTIATGHSYDDINNRYDSVGVVHGVPSTNVLLGNDPGSDRVSDLLNGPPLRGAITKNTTNNTNGISSHYRTFRKSSNASNISHSNSFEPLVVVAANANANSNGNGNGNTNNNNNHFLTGDINDQHHAHSHSPATGNTLPASLGGNQRDVTSILTGAVRTAAASVGTQDNR